MTQFNTAVSIPSYPFSIDYHQQILLLGSCFAEHIAARLTQFKFKTQLNPVGILYNPVSIQHALELIAGRRKCSQDDLFLHQGLWHSFDHHGQFSDPSREVAHAKIQQSLESTRAFLHEPIRIIITLGTAHVFYHRVQKRIVANCHKLESSSFDRYRLSLSEVIQSLKTSLEILKELAPESPVIFTVSPVRHLRDGNIENQRSKATLLLALAEICQQHPLAFYFPAYEILLDELRDYRFYAEDMTHPSSTAINYIWEKFGEALFAPTTRDILDKVVAIVRASLHRPIHPDSTIHQQFLQQQIQKVTSLEKTYPFLDFSAERAIFERA